MVSHSPEHSTALCGYVNVPCVYKGIRYTSRSWSRLQQPTTPCHQSWSSGSRQCLGSWGAAWDLCASTCWPEPRGRAGGGAMLSAVLKITACSSLRSPPFYPILLPSLSQPYLVPFRAAVWVPNVQCCACNHSLLLTPFCSPSPPSSLPSPLPSTARGRRQGNLGRMSCAS